MSDAAPISTAAQPAAPALPESVLWTVKDAAAFLRISVRKLRYGIRTPESEPGSIPCVRFGRMPRFIPDDLRAWAAAGFPPAGTFKAWRDAEERRRKRAG